MRDDPAVGALGEDHAVAPVRRAAGDHDGELAADVGRFPSIDARGVARADLDPFFRGASKPSCFSQASDDEPRPVASTTRSARMFSTTPRALDTHAADAVAFAEQPLHVGSARSAARRGTREAAANLAFEHRTAREQAGEIARAGLQPHAVADPVARRWRCRRTGRRRRRPRRSSRGRSFRSRRGRAPAVRARGGPAARPCAERRRLETRRAPAP